MFHQTATGVKKKSKHSSDSLLLLFAEKKGNREGGGEPVNMLGIVSILGDFRVPKPKSRQAICSTWNKTREDVVLHERNTISLALHQDPARCDFGGFAQRKTT